MGKIYMMYVTLLMSQSGTAFSIKHNFNFSSSVLAVERRLSSTVVGTPVIVITHVSSHIGLSIWQVVPSLKTLLTIASPKALLHKIPALLTKR